MHFKVVLASTLQATENLALEDARKNLSTGITQELHRNSTGKTR